MSAKWKTAKVYSQVVEAKRLMKEARENCPHKRIEHTGSTGGHDPWPTYGCTTCEAEISYSEAETRNFGRDKP